MLREPCRVGGRMSTERRLLIVDDDPLTRTVIACVMQAAGWKTEEAEDGAAALAVVKIARFDVVLSDLQMPGLRGGDLAAALRSEVPELTRIVAMTATLKSLKAPEGFDGILHKPFSAQDLDVLLERAPFRREVPAAKTVTALNEETYAKLLSSMPKVRLQALCDFALEDASKRAASIEAALVQKNFDKAASQAHAIKGSAGMIGALRLQAAASELEVCCADDSALVPLAEILSAIEELRRILQERFLS